MNVYDFDKTIYDGDSTADFIFFSIKRHPLILLNLPKTAAAFLMYAARFRTKTQFKEKMYGMFKYIPDIDSEVELFWETHKNGIKKWYLDQKRSDDLIISASPEFLLAPICDGLGVRMMASRVNKKSGSYTGENCYGKEKVRRLYETVENPVIDEFYSDSLSDTPLAELAKKAFLVKGNDLSEWN